MNNKQVKTAPLPAVSQLDRYQMRIETERIVREHEMLKRWQEHDPQTLGESAAYALNVAFEIKHMVWLRDSMKHQVN